MIKVYKCKTLSEKLKILKTCIDRGYDVGIGLTNTIEDYFKVCGSTESNTMEYPIVVMNKDKCRLNFYQSSYNNYSPNNEVDTLEKLLNLPLVKKTIKKHIL